MCRAKIRRTLRTAKAANYQRVESSLWKLKETFLVQVASDSALNLCYESNYKIYWKQEEVPK